MEALKSYLRERIVSLDSECRDWYAVGICGRDATEEERKDHRARLNARMQELQRLQERFGWA